MQTHNLPTKFSCATLLGFDMDYDRILSHIGELSRWNLVNLALLWLPPMMGGIIVLQTSFSVLPPSKFRCRMPCEDESATYGDPRFNESMIHPEVLEDFFILIKQKKLNGTT